MSLRDRALVHAEQAHLADEGVTVTLNTWASTCAGRVGLGVHQLGGVTLALQEVRRVAFAGLGSSLSITTSSSSATPAPLRADDEAHRDQVALAQRLLQRRVQLAGRSTSPSFR
jgi:hypothetical protein